MPCQKRECPKEKSSERSQILSCRESMSMPRPVIGSTSQQYVIRPSDAKTQTSNANLSKTNIKHDITYCTSDTCRNSSSCIKILPKYCPYGLKKDSDSVACPGPCRESINGNELNNFVYRHSVTSLPEVNAESLMKLTNACPAGQEISSLPCKSLAPVMPNPTDKDRINRKSLQKSGLKESMQTSSAECSECNSEGELPLRKAPCCPDVDFDVIADVGRLSQEYICPSLKSYLDKQTSNQNCNKQKPFDCSTTKPSTISKGNVKSTSCTVTAADQPNSSEPSCPAVCQSRDFDHIGNLEQRISVSVPGKSSCCSNNQQSSLKLTSTDLGAGQEYCQNDSRIAPMARRSQLPEKLENRHYSINEPKKIDMISPCTRESFPCCETSTRKSANVIEQDKLTKPGCNKPSCAMKLCGSKSNEKCNSASQLLKSSTQQTYIPKTGKQNDSKSQRCCSSTLCTGNEPKTQLCTCRYPPAFQQFSCTGCIAGNCDCANRNT